MSLPHFNELGDLPAGVHPAALSEIRERFAREPHARRIIGQRLERAYQLASATGELARFIVFGSFVTSKLEPNDVDIFMLMEDSFDAGKLSLEVGLLFNHPAAQAHFGCSVFWVRKLAAMGGEQNTIEYWQVRRDGGQRGIVEVTGG